MMDRQAVFNKVVQHLRKQGSRAMDEDGCCYRAPNGKMCAIGCLIPDEYYHPDIEGLLAWSLPITLLQASIPNFEQGEDGTFLTRLQDIHDNNNVSAWESLWQALATEYSLKMPAKQ